MIREGLKRLIDSEADMSVVGEAGEGEDAVARISALQPEVAVLAGSGAGSDPLQTTHRLRQAAPRVKIVVLATHEDPGRRQALLDAGVSGYVLKRATAGELIKAIRAANEGKPHVDPHQDADAGPGDTASRAAATAEKLSEREASVLRLIAQGYSNKEIASLMELSVKTIETYKTRSMEKLRLRSRVDIVRHAIRQGWLLVE